MNRAAFAVAALLLAALLSPAAAAEADTAVPQLKELRKPVVKVAAVEDEKPVIPGRVSPDKRIDDPALLFPGQAVAYFMVPDAAKLAVNLAASPAGHFRNEPAYALLMKNNRFGMESLFADLPASAITPSRVAAFAAVFRLAYDLCSTARQMAGACYFDDNGHLNVAFAFDIGLDREAAFDVCSRWETGLHLDNPGSFIERGDHSGNYLDFLTLAESNPQSPAEIAMGFAENIAIVSNNSALARQCQALLAGGDSVASSEWGELLKKSLPASAQTDAVGYIRMDALLRGLSGTPAARSAVAAWADYIGHGGRQGQAMYYGLQFTPGGARETFLMPSPGLASSASLIELLAKRLKPAEKFTTPTIFPYQPNPTLFLAGSMEGRQLGGLLRQERRLFGISNDLQYFTIPAGARRLFTNEVLDVLSGEFGLAFYPPRNEEEGNRWLMILPCKDNPAALLPGSEYQAERGGVSVRSNEMTVGDAPSWAVISPDLFRRAGTYQLLIASHGDLVFSAVDQLLANSAFANNKDFVRALAAAEAGPGMAVYYNLPEITIRRYPDFSSIMRGLYPRSSGLNSRPPLTVLRRYARGVFGAIASSPEGAAFSRLTVQAPVPMLAALGASVVLGYPAGLRETGRTAMEESRTNLQDIWMRMQLFSSRFGHFPDSLEDLKASMRSDTEAADIDAMFTAPAALSRMPAREAAAASYGYLAGVTVNDEPDLPLIIEASPWSDDFAGMHPDSAAKSPAETGDYQSFRQYIRLDGGMVVMTEKDFQENVVPRMKERE